MFPCYNCSMNENLQVEIGKRVLSLRKKSGLNQTQVAELVGLTQSGYALIEGGKRLAGIDHLLKMTEIFLVPLSQLLPEYLMIDPKYVTDPRISDLLAAWPSLTETQRQAFHQMLQGFTENNH